MNVRRLPGFMYHYKVVTLFLASTVLLVVYLLLHWGIMCTNLEAWRHVSNVMLTMSLGSKDSNGNPSKSSTTEPDFIPFRRNSSVSTYCSSLRGIEISAEILNFVPFHWQQ